MAFVLSNTPHCRGNKCSLGLCAAGIGWAGAKLKLGKLQMGLGRPLLLQNCTPGTVQCPLGTAILLRGASDEIWRKECGTNAFQSEKLTAFKTNLDSVCVFCDVCVCLCVVQLEET